MLLYANYMQEPQQTSHTVDLVNEKGNINIRALDAQVQEEVKALSARNDQQAKAVAVGNTEPEGGGVKKTAKELTWEVTKAVAVSNTKPEGGGVKKTAKELTREVIKTLKSSSDEERIEAL